MKKTLCLLLILAAFLAFGGCGNSKAMLALTPFTCEIQMISDGKITEGIFTYKSKNSMCLEFSYEDSLGGVKAEYENGALRYLCDGVTVDAPAELKNVPVYGLFSAMNLLAQSDIEISEDEENVFSLSDNNGKFTYTVDADSKRILHINGMRGKIIFRYR